VILINHDVILINRDVILIFAARSLTLNFSPAASISAGVPYLVKWATRGIYVKNGKIVVIQLKLPSVALKTIVFCKNNSQLFRPSLNASVKC